MFFWIVLFVLFFILFLINLKLSENTRKILFYIFLLLITCLGIFRNNIGADYFAYQKIYFLMDWDSTKIFSIEPTFSILCILLKKYSFSSQALFAIYAILINLFIMLGIKYYFPKNYLALNSFLLCWCLYFIGWYNSLTVIRQYLAVAIFFWSTKFLFEDKFIKYLISILCATLVHYSSIILILLYPLRKFKIEVKYFIIILVSFIMLSSQGIFLNIIIKIVNGLPFTIYKLTFYINDNFHMLHSFVRNNGTGLGILFYYIFFSSVLIFENNNSKICEIFIRMIEVGLLIKTIFFMIPPLARISIFFEIFGFVAFGYIISSNIKFNDYKEKIKLSFVICMVLGMMIISLYNINRIPNIQRVHSGHNTNFNIEYKFKCDFFVSIDNRNNIFNY